MELARTKKELAEVKMERDILKKQQRTLPRSRCLVRDDERIATQLSDTTPEASVEGTSQQLLCLGGPAAIKMASGRSSTRA